MDRYWLLTSTTYATWLPGDRRGFVSDIVEPDGHRVRHNVPGTECDRDVLEMVVAAQQRMKGQPIYFKEEQAQVALESFLSTAKFRGWVLLAGSVMCNHFHLVTGVPGDPEPDTLLQKFKSHASRCLNESFGKPASETWWTRSGSRRKLPDARAVFAAMRYTIRQHRCLAAYLCPPEVYEEMLGAPPDDTIWRTPWRAGDDSPRGR